MADPAAALPFTVDLNGTHHFPAYATDTLLAAALRAGVPMVSSCRNGTCRSCLCRLASGSVAYTIEWPGLSADEKREGLILPCVARPTSDVAVAPA